MLEGPASPCRPRYTGSVLLSLLPILTPLAAAEGFEQNSEVMLLAATELFVDIQADDECIYWSGKGDVTAVKMDSKGKPTGLEIPITTGTHSTALLEAGTYRLTLEKDQPSGWDVSVYKEGVVDPMIGRVFSDKWQLQTTGEEDGFDHTFYATTRREEREAAEKAKDGDAEEEE